MRWLGVILLGVAGMIVGMLAIRSVSEGVYRGDWAYIGLGIGVLFVASGLFYGVYRLLIEAAGPTRAEGALEGPSAAPTLAGIGWAIYGALLAWAAWSEAAVAGSVGFILVMAVETAVVVGLAYLIGIRRNRIAAIVAIAFGMGILLLGPVIGLPMLPGLLNGLGVLSLAIAATLFSLPRLHGGIGLGHGRIGHGGMGHAAGAT
jgi:hypothetical protein